MAIQEAVILAGGLGTRLQDAVPELPKCLGPVAGKPFLEYLLEYWQAQGIQRFVFALGYRSDQVEAFLKKHIRRIHYSISREEEPLGTGGAVRQALQQCLDESILILNGDTFFGVGLGKLEKFHFQQKAVCSLALKPMQEISRYGLVRVNPEGLVESFLEKQYYPEGLVNGGVYLLEKTPFLNLALGQKFSFEKDFLENYQGEVPLFGQVQDEYFIDIGVPEDYDRAQRELPLQALATSTDWLKSVDDQWTLFLDRDGVINRDKPGSYVFAPEEFHFYDGVLEALSLFSKKFRKVVIVTNQRGIGKNLMSAKDLDAIHQKMLQEIRQTGGRIDGIYYSTSLRDDHPQRKPNPGMAFLAKQEFPEIDLSRSIMVGNNFSDMGFGRNAGMKTIFLTTTEVLPGHREMQRMDGIFPSLWDFAKALQLK